MVLSSQGSRPDVFRSLVFRSLDVFRSLECVARCVRDDYNTIRPHSSIDYRTPENFRAEILGQAPDSGQARHAGPSLARLL
jgi:transposase InsO family protein